MNNITAIITFLVFTISGFSQNPLHSISVSDTDSFSVEGKRSFEIYGLSDHTKPIVQESNKRKILAADHKTGINILTNDPKTSIQQILNQLSNQTGLNLGSFRDSVFSANLEPNFLLMAVDQKSVWNILLTKKDEGKYQLSVTCLIDE